MTSDEACELYGIPKALWDCEYEDCTPAALTVMENYCRLHREQHQIVRDGVGLFFSGDAGVGKSTAAVQLVKKGRLNWRGHPTDLTAYFTRAGDLRDAVRFHREFRNEGSIEELVRRVKVLIVDDLTAADFSDPYFQWLGLVINRAGSGRPTFFTSILSFVDLCAVQPIWPDQVGKALYEVAVTGTNRRVADIKAVKAELRKKHGGDK